jgi:hypothetical protein
MGWWEGDTIMRIVTVIGVVLFLGRRVGKGVCMYVSE